MAGNELGSQAGDQQDLSLTVYGDEFALVRDSRVIDLPTGVSRLAFGDVSAEIRPQTARLYGAPHVLEQNFDFDLLSPRKLLEKYVGRDIGLVRRNLHSGADEFVKGRLLSATEGGVVFRIGNQIETGEPGTPWRFVFDEAPENMRERPTLTMLLDNPVSGPQ